MPNKEMIMNILRNDMPELREKYHVLELGLFGSYAKDLQTAQSDIDILVELEKGYKSILQFLHLKYYLEEKLGKPVDLVMKNAVKPQLKDSIYREIYYV